MRTGLLTALLVLALLVAYGYLGRGYLSERQQQENLDSRIAEAENTLALIPEPASDLETQLAEAQAGLAAVEGEFPVEVNSTQVVNAVLELADDIGVRAMPLIIDDWRAERIGGHDYRVLRLNVSVTGSLSQVMEFTERLETGEPSTLTIEWLNVILGLEPSPENGGPALSASADMGLAIYTREPSG